MKVSYYSAGLIVENTVPEGPRIGLENLSRTDQFGKCHIISNQSQNFWENRKYDDTP